jgi:hypothetical protein
MVFSLKGALIATGEKSRSFFLGMGTAAGLIISGERISIKKKQKGTQKLKN